MTDDERARLAADPVAFVVALGEEHEPWPAALPTQQIVEALTGGRLVIAGSRMRASAFVCALLDGTDVPAREPRGILQHEIEAPAYAPSAELRERAAPNVAPAWVRHGKRRRR